MNNIFDIHRFGKVLVWNLMAYWKKYVRTVLVLALTFSCICIIGLYNSMDIDGYLGNVSGGVMLIGFFALLLSGAGIFDNMKTKQSRATFLMLPASNLEKYMARLAWTTVGSVLMLLLSVMLADVIQFLFSIFITPGGHGSITAHIFAQFASDNTFSSQHFIVNNGKSWLGPHYPVWLSFLAYMLYAHSFFTLGGAFYRKYVVLLTVLSSFVLAFAVLWFLDSIDFEGSFIIDDLHAWNPWTVMNILTSGLLLLAALHYWLAYKLFTRMQVICNKWLNI